MYNFTCFVYCHSVRRSAWLISAFQVHSTWTFTFAKHRPLFNDDIFRNLLSHTSLQRDPDQSSPHVLFFMTIFFINRSSHTPTQMNPRTRTSRLLRPLWLIFSLFLKERITLYQVLVVYHVLFAFAKQHSYKTVSVKRRCIHRQDPAQALSAQYLNYSIQRLCVLVQLLLALGVTRNKLTLGWNE